MFRRATPPAGLVCRGALLPALHFEPMVCSAAAALAAITELAGTPEALVLMVFPHGHVDDDTASSWSAGRSNAWPNGARRRSLPPLPALRITGVGDRPYSALVAAAEAAFTGRPLQRRFAYDAVVLGADGTVNAVFWTITAPASDGSSDRPRSSRRSPPSCRPPPRARR